MEDISKIRLTIINCSFIKTLYTVVQRVAKKIIDNRLRLKKRIYVKILKNNSNN